MRPSSLVLVLVLSGCVAAAGGPGASGPDDGRGGKTDDGAAAARGQDVRSTRLAIDLSSREATAEIVVQPDANGEIALEVRDLDIARVDVDGAAHEHVVTDGMLRVRIDDDSDADATLRVAYGFREHSMSDGWDPSSGTTLLWPYFCGNLFPCDSAPSEGMAFALELAGVPEGAVAVYPREVPADGPPYMLAFAVGDYAHEELGTTPAGTKVSVYYLAGDEADARAGTEHLAGVFAFLEETYGAYTFGSEVASVSADWSGGALGGMEHHPLWHVARGAMDDDEVHAHEAAHGWFGNGVRIRCWEDFVLSEGVTSYAAARALEVVGGAEVGEQVWASYREDLESVVASDDTEAWPEGCGAVDILHHPLWSSVPYMKGAFFLRAVADEIGAEALDRALARFYRDHVGTAAGVADLLDSIDEETAFDPRPLAESWLRSRGIPR